MIIKIRQIQDGDLEWVKQSPLEEAVKNYPDICPPNTTYTGLVDDKIVGVGGVVIFWEGVGEGWIMLRKDVLDFKISMYKCVQRMMDLVVKHHQLKRLQVVVRTDFPQAKKMVEALGFKQEGLMTKYCPDKTDAWLYARIEE